MKYAVILVLMAAGISAPAMADWVLVFRYSDADVYVAPSRIDRVKDKATMWSLTDARVEKEALGYRYRSQMTLVEYDCVRMTSLAVRWQYFKGQMGQGELAGEYPPVGYFPGYQPLPLLHDTPEAVAWGIACATR